MAFGLTAQGLLIKTLEDLKGEIEASLRDKLGKGINLLPTELLGQIVGIIAERDRLIEEKILGVYDSSYPDTANGVSLDNVVSITGIKRLAATKGSGTVANGNACIAYGVLGTNIPAGSIISVDGNPVSRWVTTNLAVIGAGTDEVQDIDFSAVPDAGDWTLVFDGEETGTLAFNDNAAAVQSALNALPNLSGVTVSGNYSTGFTVTFAGADGSQDQPLLQMGDNNLTVAAVQVNVTFVETTPGVLPNVTVEVEAESPGEIPAYADTLTVIETPVAGWDAFNNPSDLTTGKNTETDPELRIRRRNTLATAGAGTLEAIRAAILAIDEVKACVVYENIDDVVDIFGRPPHSVEAVVLDGDDNDIADVIWVTAPAGIKKYGGVSVNIIDSQGFTQEIKFSRPTEIDIYVEVDVVTDPAFFPVDGDEAIKQAIVDFAADNFSIGDDVITVKLYCPIVDVAGILDVTIRIGTAPNPLTDNNIAIAPDEISVWDTANIEVTVT